MVTLLNRFDDNYIMKKEDIMEIVAYYTKEKGIQSSIKDVFFTSNNNVSASFDPSNHEIYIHPNKVIENSQALFADIQKKYQIDDKYYSYFINFYYLHAIYRELEHANQEARHEKNDSKEAIYNYLFELCTRIHQESKPFYEQNRILIPNEIEAHNNSLFTPSVWMKYTKLPSREGNIMYLQYLQSLIANYKKGNGGQLITPIEQLAAIYPNVDLETIKELTKQTKLKKIARLNLGLSVEPKELTDLEEVITKKTNKILHK